MSASRIEEIVARWRAETGTEPKPCSDAELDALERELGLRLPAAHRALLACDGHGGLGILGGTDWTYRDLVGIQTSARQLARDDGLELDASQLVLATHQGYQFFFVDVTRGDDPPLMHYLERSGRPTQFAPTLSAGVAELVTSEVEACRDSIFALVRGGER